MATRTATDSVPGLGACGTRNIAKLLSKRQTAYVYLFAHPTQSFVPLPGDGPGSVTVGHATEIPYVFGDVTGLQNVDGERELATQISTYWTNFAKYGNPTPFDNNPQLPKWKPVMPKILAASQLEGKRLTLWGTILHVFPWRP